MNRNCEAQFIDFTFNEYYLDYAKKSVGVREDFTLYNLVFSILSPYNKTKKEFLWQ